MVFAGEGGGGGSSSGGRRMAFWWGFAVGVVRGRWFMVFASLLIMAASGATYIFGIYSKDLKAALGYDQQTLNTLSFFKDVGPTSACCPASSTRSRRRGSCSPSAPA
uniref:Nodulin-like domain-containing protein n=1 Tax=Ananas comosus var. bracteatus TaxID=296719 RepID=A0A6V7QF42_ANACO|nr:unnamed protein product [Ananas comosus var. bracteatus]